MNRRFSMKTGRIRKIIKWTLDKGPDPNARNSAGKTALDLARGMRIEEIEEILKAHGAKQ